MSYLRLLATTKRPLPAVDRLLAATASSHDLVMVTRNARDFAGLGISVIDPWVAEGPMPGPRHRVQEPAHGVSPALRRRRRQFVTTETRGQLLSLPAWRAFS